LAKRIEHQEVLFPTPTQAILDGMALAGYNAFANSVEDEVDGRLRDWDDSADFIKMGWMQSSRAMYAFLAVAAGAKITEIPDNPKD
tara:strand:+ start:261 stop:518 length:258 start_codon:yes stop_codon:yes gene_type:complete